MIIMVFNGDGYSSSAPQTTAMQCQLLTIFIWVMKEIAPIPTAYIPITRNNTLVQWKSAIIIIIIIILDFLFFSFWFSLLVKACLQVTLSHVQFKHMLVKWWRTTKKPFISLLSIYNLKISLFIDNSYIQESKQTNNSIKNKATKNVWERERER